MRFIELYKECEAKDLMSRLGEEAYNLDRNELITICKNLAWFVSNNKQDDKFINYLKEYEEQLFEEE